MVPCLRKPVTVKKRRSPCRPVSEGGSPESCRVLEPSPEFIATSVAQAVSSALATSSTNKLTPQIYVCITYGFDYADIKYHLLILLMFFVFLFLQTWWSKVSGRFRNIRRTKLRVLEPGMASHVCEVLTPEELAYRYEQGVTGETDLMVTKRSLTSGEQSS